jgi:hypothetical protein
MFVVIWIMELYCKKPNESTGVAAQVFQISDAAENRIIDGALSMDGVLCSTDASPIYKYLHVTRHCS